VGRIFGEPERAAGGVKFFHDVNRERPEPLPLCL
jgi:hypothetical protein